MLARALIVGCGCRGRALGAACGSGAGRSAARPATSPVSRRSRPQGIEAALADPARPGTILDLVGDVTVIHWLLGSAAGPEDVDALHGDSLEALLERLVDTPVRGFVYEAAGRAPDRCLRRGAALVRVRGPDVAHPGRGRRCVPGATSVTGPDEMAEATQRLIG